MDPGRWIDLAVGYAWPAVAAVAILFFRGPFGRLVTAVGDAIGKGQPVKLGVANVTLELAAATTQKESGTSPVTELQYAAEPGMFSSGGPDIIAAIIGGPDVEAATIDLRTGEGFITSRLYLTATLLARQRGVRALGFVRTSGVREGVYVGACLVEDLIRAIVWRFPEYDAAFALALHQGWWMQSNPTGVLMANVNWPGPTPRPAAASPLDARGRLPPADAGRVVGGFLQSLQVMGAPPGAVTPNAPPPEAPPGWVWKPGWTIMERGEWVTREWLKEALGPALLEAQVVRSADVTEKVVLCLGSYVGLVDDAGCLIELISRDRLLEQLARASLPKPPRQAPEAELRR